jgi:hypothetical protein
MNVVVLEKQTQVTVLARAISEQFTPKVENEAEYSDILILPIENNVKIIGMKGESIDKSQPFYPIYLDEVVEAHPCKRC